MKHLSPEQISRLVAGIPGPEEAHARSCLACGQEVEQARKVLTLFGRSVRDNSVREWTGKSGRSERSIPEAIASTARRSNGARRAPVAWVLAAAALAAAVAIPAYRDSRDREIQAQFLRDEEHLRDQQLLNAVNAQLSRNGPLAMDPLMFLMSAPAGGPKGDSTKSESGGVQ